MLYAGGKFANGAVIAAFAHAYNHEAHRATNGDAKTRTLLEGAQDGHLTLAEANAWWRHMEGQPLSVDLNRIDISGVSVGDFPDGVGSYKKLSVSGVNDFLVHGKLGFTLGSNRTVTVPRPELYDFD